MNNGMWDSSECSSGCESGWTVYLEQSFLSPYPPSNRSHDKFVSRSDRGKQVELEDDDDEDEDEDMSMVSDASSGPPHFQQHDNNGCYYNHDPLAINGKRKKNKEKVRRTNDLHLDDTASSPVFDFSQNNSTMIHNQAVENNNSLDFSQGYSATHFQGRSSSSSSSSSHPEQLASYFQYLPTTGNQMQQNQWHGGSMMGMRR